MFTHQGKSRTLSHNIKVASLLSGVAGMVNVIGFLAVQRLTTNVTGHFAFFIDECFKLNFSGGVVYLIYILSFLLGSFSSSLCIEVITRKSDRNIYLLPVSLEAFILAAVALTGGWLIANQPNLLACILLFAMGLQNSLVTRISNSMVRTTHLTGLFTDLGIELSQLFFYKQPGQRHTLLSSIKLRLVIILFFFLGGVVAGVLYVKFNIYTLLLAAAVLVAGLFYDRVSINLALLHRKYLK